MRDGVVLCEPLGKELQTHRSVLRLIQIINCGEDTRFVAAWLLLCRALSDNSEFPKLQ